MLNIADMHTHLKKLIKLTISCIVIFFSFSTFTVSAQTTDPDTDILVNLEYIASYQDLMNAFGTNWQAGSDHYLNNGIAEGRTTTFNACEYLASYNDLLQAFGTDYTSAVTHYINNGRFEGRVISFNSMQYMLANPDVLAAVSASSSAACEHYINYGRFDGHRKDPGKKLIGLGNKCLDAGGGYTASQGSPVQLWDCVGNVPQQQWTLNSNGLVVGIGGNCLTPSNFSLANGSPLIMWPCDNSNQTQQWTLTQDAVLVSSSDPTKCVDIANINSANGTAAWVYDCWGGSNQLWSPAAGLTLSGLAGKCLDAGTATISLAPNSRATLYTCNQAPQQQWVFDRTRIKGFGGLCLAMQNSQIYSGAPLVMTTCSDDPGPTGQHWYMTTDNFIRSIDNTSLCINVLGASTTDGSPVAAYTCTPSASNDKWVQN